MQTNKIFNSNRVIRNMVFLFVLTISFSSLAGQEEPVILYIKNYGAIGDGVTDDGPAIRQAIDAAIAASPGVRLLFEPGMTYRMDAWQGNSQISLSGVSDISIEGNDSHLILHPENGVFHLLKCKEVRINGFIINYDPLPFTQGTIREVDAANGTFYLEIHENYPLPPPHEIVEKYSPRGWNWGSVMDPVEKHRRWDVSMHFFMESVKPLSGRKYRIKVTDTYVESLKPVIPGDRFAFSFMVTDEGERILGSIIGVHESSDCTIENIIIHTARYGMNYAVTGNEGKLFFRNNKIMFEKDTHHLITTHKDGMHCKDNRYGPVIENCYFEGMLDDAINIGANTAMAIEVHSKSEFSLKGPSFRVGDKVMVFDPVSGYILAETKVTEASRNRIRLADPVDNVVTGSKRPHEDIRSTHFYNMSYANSSFVIRNCIFKPQRRHAMLIRSSDGLIENNIIDGVGGAAVWMGNEMGSFYEGPFPSNNIIRNNLIKNTQLKSIYIYTQSLNNINPLTRDVKVENNKITVIPGTPGIQIYHAENIELKNNQIFDQQGNDITGDAVEVIK